MIYSFSENLMKPVNTWEEAGSEWTWIYDLPESEGKAGALNSLFYLFDKKGFDCVQKLCFLPCENYNPCIFRIDHPYSSNVVLLICFQSGVFDEFCFSDCMILQN
jgi:hypothetical protein